MEQSMAKRFLAAVIAVFLFNIPAGAIAAVPETNAGAVLLMEKETGTILYENNAHARMEPASITKIMTLLLVVEAIENKVISMDDLVTTSAHAASMGGSQVYLEEGEQMTVRDLLKAVTVSSGNDAAVALGEHLTGSETAFVARMNERAAELGMNDTTFVNCTGLPAKGHLTSAYDVALMSRELIRHDLIKEFSTIWMDTLRNGQFGLNNTNKLIRFYQGATGLKTGSTDTALYCLSATAMRDGMELIAVVMKAPTSAIRFESAKSLLDFGFANYTLLNVYPGEAIPSVEVVLGETRELQPELQEGVRLLVERTDAPKVETSGSVVGRVEAPVEVGQKLGEMTVTLRGEVLKTVPIIAPEPVSKLTMLQIFGRLLSTLFEGK
jgi:D-alanyl-D-alanine carboxypeptidase (penicillin-binding protein 5/6)